MNKLKNYINLSKKSVASLVIFTILACGPGMVDYDEFMSFFMPESATIKGGDLKYAYSSQFFYNNYDDYNVGNEDTIDHEKPLNISAWSKYVGGKISKKQIEQSLYGTSSALQDWLASHQKAEAADYITFVRGIDQAYKRETVDYFTETKVDTVALIELFTNAKAALPQLKDEFVKERYAFQTIKLAMMNDQPQEALQVYDAAIKPLKKKTYISDWALSRKAGALIALGDSVQAYYDFAQVFDRCPSRRHAADLSIRSRGIGFQEEAVALCKNSHEKAAVYAFAAIKPSEEGLKFLEKMVDLDPTHPLIELVMSREINKNEALYYKQVDYWMGEPDANKEKENHDKAIPYWQKLKDFATACSANPQIPKTGFWLGALSYLEYIEKNFDKSAEYLAEAKLVVKPNTGLSKQLEIQELLLLSNKSPKITPELEDEITPVLASFGKPKDFRMSNALAEASKQLIARYYGRLPHEKEEKQGWLASCMNKKNEPEKVTIPYPKAKAYLLAALTSYQTNSGHEYGGYMSQTDMYAIEDTTESKTIEQVIAYFQESKKSAYDSLLQSMTGFSQDHLYVLLGRRALSEHDYAKATKAFEKVAPEVWRQEPWKSYFNEDPFFMTTTNKEKRSTYTPVTFAQKMQELASRLADNPNDFGAAYLLGCGAYSMSYQGNSWVLLRREWSTGEVNGYVQKDYETDYYLATKAKSYFETALKSPDAELAAKAAFGAAKCENAAFFVHANSQSGEEDYTVFEARIAKDKARDYEHYFTLLKEKYKNTKFQKSLIRECSDYSTFVKVKK